MEQKPFCALCHKELREGELDDDVYNPVCDACIAHLIAEDALLEGDHPYGRNYTEDYDADEIARDFEEYFNED